MRKIVIIAFLISFIVSSFAQIQRVEPPYWWKNMKTNKLQLLVYGDNISKYYPEIKGSKSVEINEIHQAESPNYVFLDLVFAENIKDDKFEIHFIDRANGKTTDSYTYKLYDRREGSAERIGFSNEDVIYLVMPDRFANGNTKNDSHPDMLEKADITNPDGRYGGDIEGIRENIHYLNDLGITALWINPLLENNMEKYSYHGYAITDFYKIDPRFGSFEEYTNLIKELHENDIKIIADMVFNHCGGNHWWMKDLPFKNWIHQFDEFTRSNYRAETIMDPHASKQDKTEMMQGWFDTTMPDMNQRNEFLANYLIQNTIWWIEAANLDGIRMDTYPYSYQEFMAEWMQRIHLEYPNFNVVGETWLQNETHTAYFQNTTFSNIKENSHLNCLTDFPTFYAINSAFNEEDSWTGGLAKLYYVLTKDFIYTNPDNLVIFADNHDLTRFYSSQGKDLNKWKMGMTYLLTTRGIPMIYYGTEILSEGFEHHGHSEIRKYMLGGWPGDDVSYFDKQHLSEDQTEAMNYLSKLIKLRTENKSLQKGKLTHYFPQNSTYVYFRELDGETIMVAFNNSDEEKSLKLDRFSENIRKSKSGTDLITNQEISLEEEILLSKKSAIVIKLNLPK